MKKSFVRGTWQVKRAFSPCVIHEGAAAPSISPGTPGKRMTRQVARRRFRRPVQADLPQHREDARRGGANCSDMVTMTVFLIDARYTTRMTERRTELFGKDFPQRRDHRAGFAQPEMMIEVQGIAVTS
jgi:hypothetical protein